MQISVECSKSVHSFFFFFPLREQASSFDENEVMKLSFKERV